MSAMAFPYLHILARKEIPGMYNTVQTLEGIHFILVMLSSKDCLTLTSFFIFPV